MLGSKRDNYTCQSAEPPGLDWSEMLPFQSNLQEANGEGMISMENAESTPAVSIRVGGS